MNFSTEQSSRHTQNRDRLTEGSRLVVTEGGGVGGCLGCVGGCGVAWGLTLSRCRLLHIGWVSKALPYSTHSLSCDELREAGGKGGICV